MGERGQLLIRKRERMGSKNLYKGGVKKNVTLPLLQIMGVKQEAPLGGSWKGEKKKNQQQSGRREER